MLSSILSRIFLWLFVLSLIISMTSVFIQISQRPFTFKTGTNSNFSLGEPGIQAEALRMINQEKMAPDTIVNYSVTKPDSTPGSKGEITLNDLPFNNSKSTLNKIITTEKKLGNTIKLDTQYYLIAHQVWPSIISNGSVSYGEKEDLADGRIVFTKTQQDKNGRTLPPILHDTFANSREANIFSITNTKGQNYIIEQNGNFKETLRLRPANIGQHILFVCYDIAYFGFILLLFYMMYRLFKNFAADDFFSFTNVKLLRNTGICLLAIQLVKFLFYFFYLSNIHPVKIIITGSEATRGAQYDLFSGVEYLKIFLGLGILILSYIFLNGLRLKEEQSLTV